MPESRDSFGARSTLRVGERRYEFFRLDALAATGCEVSSLPWSLRILLENLLRNEDGTSVTADHIRRLAAWNGTPDAGAEIAFMPARVLTQDLTGVPAVVDLAAMRDALREAGGDPQRVNPQIPVELVIDHSVQVDAWGSQSALRVNRARDYERNGERYALLRWAQQAFSNLRVVPPASGICHQVNLEYLARVVFTSDELPQSRSGPPLAYPDTLVGMDSHTPMVNGLGVLGWGVGGIEAEAAMLGQRIGMLLPEVIGFRLEGRLGEGATATDLVLTIAQKLRQRGVVGRFVEFYGPGVASVPLADRATIGNMSPEYGATCAMFPVDDETLRYLELTGRPRERIALVEAYMKEQGLYWTPAAPDPVYTDTMELDLATVEPSIAGPGRPHDRVPLTRAAASFAGSLAQLKPKAPSGSQSFDPAAAPGRRRRTIAPVPDIDHGAVAIAAITSCTNTSNPRVMIAAGLLARKAVQRKLAVKPWVKTSLAPGSRAVTDYLRRAGLLPDLAQLGFHLVGYGCTTCIGNAGPLPPEVSAAIRERNLVACAVLSGNRNFEGRIHAEVRANYLMSPPLVVAYALAGSLRWDPDREPLGIDGNGTPVWLRELWPTHEEIEAWVRESIDPGMYRRAYRQIYTGDRAWQELPVPGGDLFEWDAASTYVRRPPFVAAVAPAAGMEDVRGARVLAMLGDSVTTDHVSPAGAIRPESPAGMHLTHLGVSPRDFNSYGARRGNHDVMVRGTFASPRVRNQLVPGVEGGVTLHLPGGEVTSIHEAAMRYQADGVPLIVLAGREYGSGSSRDWAAKGPLLLGVRAVIAESFERIHRSNLIGMGVLPLEYAAGQSAQMLGLDGRERFELAGLDAATRPDHAGAREVRVRAARDEANAVEFLARVRIDTPIEAHYFRAGGILPYVLGQLASVSAAGQPAGAMPAGPQRPAAPPSPDTVEHSSEESFPASDPPAY